MWPASVLVFVVSAWFPPGLPAFQTPGLAEGGPHELSPGDIHTHQLSLDEGELLQVSAVQLSGDLELRLEDSQGERVRSSYSWPVGESGPERISYVADNAGEFQLSVRPRFGQRATYRFERVVRRHASESDLERNSGEQLFQAALNDKGDDVRAGGLERAGDLLEQVQSHARAGLAYTLASQLWVRAGDLERSVSAAARGVAAAVVGNSARIEGRSRFQLMAGFSTLGRGDEFLKEADRTLAVLEEIESRHYLPAALSELASFHSSRGERDVAADLFARAEAVALEGDVFGLAAAALNGSAINELHRGRYLEGLAIMQRAREHAERVGNSLGAAMVTANMGGVFGEMGDIDAALEHWDQAERFARESGDAHYASRLLATLAINRAFQHHEEGNHEVAYEGMRHALDLSRDRGDASLITDSTIKLGIIAMELGKLEEAQRLLDTAGDMVRDAQDRDLEITLNMSYGQLAMKRSDNDSAETYLRTALDRARQVSNLHEMREALLTRALHERQTGQLDAAIGSAREAAEVSDQIRSGLTGTRLRVFAFAEVRVAHDLWTELLLERWRSGNAQTDLLEAFEISDLGRSRSLSELMARAREKPLSALDRELQEELAQTSRKLSDLQRLLLDRSVGSVELERLRTEAADTETELELLEARAARTEPIYGLSHEGVRTSVTSVQSSLTPDQLLLQYHVDPDKAWLFVISKTAVDAVELGVPDRLQEQIARLRKLITRPGRVSVGLQRESESTFDMLLEPVRSYLETAKELIVVPDGPLWGLPFGLLRDSAGPRTESRYVVERWAVRYAFSSAIEVRAKRERESLNENTTLLAWAAPSSPSPRRGEARPEPSEEMLRGVEVLDLDELVPLEHAEREVRAIGELFDRASVHVGEQASESSVKASRELEAVRFVHFATHAFASDSSPGESSLVMAWPPEEGQDGLLQTREILTLELDADLVVLSGCGTGLGVDVRGEGLVGLSQGFVAAGARNVVVSSWQVSDRSTTELMTHFYAALLGRAGDDSADGAPVEIGRGEVAEALRKAQLELLSTPATAHPYYWAPFVSFGGR